MSNFIFSSGRAQLVTQGPVKLHDQVFYAKIDGELLTLELVDRTDAKRDVVNTLNKKLQALLLSEENLEGYSAQVLAAIKERSGDVVHEERALDRVEHGQEIAVGCE